MANNATLNGLPAELKILLFKQLPGSLSAIQSLVHTSSAFHSAYVIARQEILTQATLCDLSARSVNLFQPYAFLEVCLRDRSYPDTQTENALTNVRAQRKVQIRARINNTTVPDIRLSVADCMSLLNIDDVLAYNFGGRADFVRWPRLMCSDSCVLRAWANGRGNYHPVLMMDAPDTSARVLRSYCVRLGMGTLAHEADGEFVCRLSQALPQAGPMLAYSELE